MAELPELLDLSEAARIAERSETTIRRWVRDGHLARHEGPAPAHGGSPPVLVSTRELLAHLATSGQEPRPGDAHPVDHPPGAPQVIAGAHGPPATRTAEEELAALRLRLAVAEAEAGLRAELATLREELARVRGDLATARAELELERARATRAEVELAGARGERDDWRARHDAREAELAALRTAGGGSWWRRLLGGPVAPTA
jgi:hypothetical protein